MGRRTLVLVIAVALAAISGFAIYQYLTGVEDSIREDIVEVAVYRVDQSQTIASGTPGEEARPLIVESTALREQVVFDGSTIVCTGPAGSNEGGNPDDASIGCPQNPQDLNVVLDGRIASGPLSGGQLITTESFARAADLEQHLRDAIAPGKVAISLETGLSTASGGFIRPGDNVNILASATLSPLQFLELISNDELRDLLIEIELDPTAADEEAPADETDLTEEDTTPTNLGGAIAGSYDVTQTILQNIQVLAVGANTRPAPIATGGLTPEAGVIVFEVTPQQAELIEYARQYTSVSLSLLPAGDYVEYDAQPIVVDDIFTLLDRIADELGQVTTGDG